MEETKVVTAPAWISWTAAGLCLAAPLTLYLYPRHPPDLLFTYAALPLCLLSLALGFAWLRGVGHGFVGIAGATIWSLAALSLSLPTPVFAASIGVVAGQKAQALLVWSQAALVATAGVAIFPLGWRRSRRAAGPWPIWVVLFGPHVVTGVLFWRTSLQLLESYLLTEWQSLGETLNAAQEFAVIVVGAAGVLVVGVLLDAFCRRRLTRRRLTRQ